MTVKEVLDYILELQGIFGAVAGVVATLFVTHYLKNKGNISIRLNEANNKLFKVNEIGITVNVERFDECTLMRTIYTLEIYNASEIPKFIKDFKYEIHLDDKIIYERIPDVMESTTVLSKGGRYDQLTYKNIEPKKLVILTLSNYVSIDDGIKEFNKIYFTCVDMKNKKKKILITTRESLL